LEFPAVKEAVTMSRETRVALATILLLGLNMPVLEGVDLPPCTSSFSSASVIPDGTAVTLLGRLSKVKDYPPHGDGWLARRLFPLADRVVVSGTLRRDGHCLSKGPTSDLDREFYILLSDASRKCLESYFSPPTQVPTHINVEMVKELSKYLGGRAPFKTAESGWERDRVGFATDTGPFHPINVSLDWDTITNSDSPLQYVEVTGPLVIDMADASVGNGQLEIHPVERIRVLSKPPKKPKCP
jgi:hypothetical protein